MASQRRLRKQKGQALVEASLVFLTLFCMILFIVDIGRLLFYQQYFAERTRVAARWALTQYPPGTMPDTTAITNVVVFNSATAPSGQTIGPFGLRTTNVSVTTATTTYGSGYLVTVRIQNFATFTVIPYIAGNWTIAPVTATVLTAGA
jgi:Flp pilus assembly protein TadG